MKNQENIVTLQSLWQEITDSKIELDSTQTDILQESLTHTSSGINPHHEKLEFLGDAVLRLAASEFIDLFYSHLSVGERSNLRGHLVSDRWLSELGGNFRIERWWRIGQKAESDVAAQATIKAELSEALIGAIYRIGGLESVHQWLTPYWQASAEQLLADPHRWNNKSALQEWSQGQGLGLPTYTSEERNRIHGDPHRFRCTVTLPNDLHAEGWGGSRRAAESQAAAALLTLIEQ